MKTPVLWSVERDRRIALDDRHFGVTYTVRAGDKARAHYLDQAEAQRVVGLCNKLEQALSETQQ